MNNSVHKLVSYFKTFKRHLSNMFMLHIDLSTPEDLKLKSSRVTYKGSGMSPMTNTAGFSVASHSDTKMKYRSFLTLYHLLSD